MNAPPVTQVTPYFTQNGQQTTSLVCGAQETFNVPGYSQVWINQTKTKPDGTVSNWSGTLSIPNVYTPICNQDEGTYKNDVYTVQNGAQGSFLGSVTATIGSGQSSMNSGTAIASVQNGIILQQANILDTLKALLQSISAFLTGK